jgi:hypothetical protein
MALLFCDNFENWRSTDNNYPGPWVRASGQWGNSSGFVNVNNTIPGVYKGSPTSAVSHSLLGGFPNTGVIICNFRVSFQVNGALDNGAILWFSDAGTEQCSLRFQPNGFFSVYRGLTTAKLGESINFFSYGENDFLDVELKIGFHNTTGTVELRVNGVQEISLINQNTRTSANNFANEVRLGRSTGSNTATPNFKHVILMDTTGSTMNDFIGPVAITSLRPNEDGHYDDWTPNTGNRFVAVNQAITDGDTTYVTADTATDKVSFKLGNLPAGVTDVFGVFAQAQIKREAETTRIARMFLRSGVDDEPIGTAQGIGPTYAFRNAAVTVSPFTTNAFDVAEINDIELGMEITT